MNDKEINTEEITELHEELPTKEEPTSAAEPEAPTAPEVTDMSAEPQSLTENPITEKAQDAPNANTASESESYLNSLIREERISNEYAEFKSLFPGVSVSELPDSVLSSIKNGVPLSAAYALYERRRAMSEDIASGVNKKNRELSFAVKNGKTSETYFSPDEVRQMSPSEVRSNYSKILDSMSHWN